MPRHTHIDRSQQPKRIPPKVKMVRKRHRFTDGKQPGLCAECGKNYAAHVQHLTGKIILL